MPHQELGSPFHLPKKAVLLGLIVLSLIIAPFGVSAFNRNSKPEITPPPAVLTYPSPTVGYEVTPEAVPLLVSTSDIYALATTTMASRYADATATTEQHILQITATRAGELDATATMESLRAIYEAGQP